MQGEVISTTFVLVQLCYQIINLPPSILIIHYFFIHSIYFANIIKMEFAQAAAAVWFGDEIVLTEGLEVHPGTEFIVMATFTYQSKNRYDILPTEVSQRIMELEKTSDNFHDKVFAKNFKCKNVKIKDNGNVLEFELIGIDAAIANAFRRILISEVATMAVKTVYFHDNTSIIQDEVLAHRLGLIPLKVDPNLFQNYNDSIDKTDLNTLVYRLDVTCRRKRSSKYGKGKTVKHETDVSNGTAENSGNSNDGLDVDYSTLENGIVYSSDLKWIKQGSQKKGYVCQTSARGHCSKAMSGQHISLECRANEARKEHLFSPVYVHYKWSEVKIVKLSLMIKKLLKRCRGLELEKVSGKRVKAVVKYPQNCRMSRNYAQDEVLRESVVVTRRPDHFIFSIESVGQLPPEVLFRRAVQVLISKCDSVIDGVKKIRG